MRCGPATHCCEWCDKPRPTSEGQRLSAENAALRDQLARETALRIAAEQRAEAMAW